MKIRGAKKIHYDSGPNMTPLVDVVMVILIFLMLVGQFGGMQHYLRSSLPRSEKGLGGVKAPTALVPDEPLDIRVDSSSDGKWVAQVGSRIRTSDTRRLTEALGQMREELAGTGTAPQSVQVVISPGKLVKYDVLIAVYQAALDARFPKVAFARSH